MTFSPSTLRCLRASAPARYLKRAPLRPCARGIASSAIHNHPATENAEPAQLKAVNLVLDGLEGTMGTKPTQATESFISTAEAKKVESPGFRVSRVVVGGERPDGVSTGRSAKAKKVALPDFGITRVVVGGERPDGVSTGRSDKAKTVSAPGFRRVALSGGRPQVVSTGHTTKAKKVTSSNFRIIRTELGGEQSHAASTGRSAKAKKVALPDFGITRVVPGGGQPHIVSTRHLAKAKKVAPPDFRITRVASDVPHFVSTERSTKPTQYSRISRPGPGSPENYRKPANYKTHFVEIAFEAEPETQTAIDALRDSEAAQSLELPKEVWRSAERFRVRVGAMQLHSHGKIKAAITLTNKLQPTLLLPNPLRYKLEGVEAFIVPIASRIKTGIYTSPNDMSGTLERLIEDIRREFYLAGLFDRTSTTARKPKLRIPLVDIRAPLGRKVEFWDPIVKDQKLANMEFGTVTVRSVGIYEIPNMQPKSATESVPERCVASRLLGKITQKSKMVEKVVETPLVPRLLLFSEMQGIEAWSRVYEPMVLLPNTDVPEPFFPVVASELAPKAVVTGGDGMEASPILSESTLEAAVAPPLEDSLPSTELHTPADPLSGDGATPASTASI